MILGPNGLPLTTNGANGVATAHKPLGKKRVPAVHPDLRGVDDWYEGAERVARTVSGPTRITKDAISDLVATSHLPGPISSSSDVPRLLEHYNKALFVYAAVYQLSSNLASVPLVATLDREDDPDSELQVLLDAPHRYLTRRDVIEQLAVYMALSGSAMLFVERAGGRPEKGVGEILELAPVNPSRVEFIPGAVPGGVRLFKYTVNGRTLDVDPANLAWAKLFNPTDDYWPMSPVLVIMRAAEMDDHLEQYNSGVLEQGGVPDVALETDDSLTWVVRHRLRRDWEHRFKRGASGGAVVLDSGVKARPLGFSPKDMQFLDLSRVTEHRILAAFGVPPIMVMDLRDAGVLANADTQIRLFWQLTLRPLGDRIASAITRAIRSDPRFGLGWGCRFAWEQVEALKEDDEKTQKAARDNYTAGLLTLNEARAEIGQDPVDGGDEFRPQGVSLFDNGQPPPGEEGQVERFVQRVEVTEKYRSQARVAYRRVLDLRSSEMEKAVAQFFLDQGDRTVAAFRAHTNQGQKAHLEDFADEDMLAAIYPYASESSKMRAEIGPIFLGAIIDAGSAKMEQLFPESTTSAFRESTDRIRSAYESWGASRVTAITEETRRALRDLLVRGFQDAWTDAQLEEEISKLFHHYAVPQPGPGPTLGTRAERIARTETATALNTGGYEASLQAMESGARIQKSWLSSRDSKVRESHAELDRATASNPIPLGQPFSNGLMYPNDMAGPPEETIQCRCSMIEHVQGGPP